MSFWTVARRPKWIAVLVLAIIAAAVLAALGQWQLERSFEGGETEGVETETVVPLTEFTAPFVPVNDHQLGQTVSLDADFVPDDYTVLEQRRNHDDLGFWVVGHGLVDGGPTLAIALGWAATLEEAEAAAALLADEPPASAIVGRYLPSEGPVESDFEAGIRSALAVPELINQWAPPTGVYSGYVISDTAPAGLDLIDAPEPSVEVSINLLNLFYALEWVIFGGFALFLWWRLVKDDVELEEEKAKDAAAALVGETAVSESASAGKVD